MDLNILARTLAERAITLDPVYDILSYRERCEAVIREAIEKTLETAIAVCDRHFEGCKDRPNCHLLDADVIRSLKQSNSGMEVRK